MWGGAWNHRLGSDDNCLFLQGNANRLDLDKVSRR